MSPESPWLTRSRPWSRRNAPWAASTPVKSGCWPGSPRLPQPVSRAGRAQPGLGRGVAGGRAAARSPAGNLQTLAAPVRSWPGGWAAGACPAYVLPAGALPRPARYARTSTPIRNWRPCSPRPTGAATVLRSVAAPDHAGAVPTIYACGLRASEARLLRAGDVDTGAGGPAAPRRHKGGKDRQVPVSAPLRERLADYHAHLPGRRPGTGSSPARPGSR